MNEACVAISLPFLFTLKPIIRGKRQWERWGHPFAVMTKFFQQSFSLTNRCRGIIHCGPDSAGLLSQSKGGTEAGWFLCCSHHFPEDW